MESTIEFASSAIAAHGIGDASSHSCSRVARPTIRPISVLNRSTEGELPSYGAPAGISCPIKNGHGFIDENKRTAFASTDTFLRWNGFYLEVDPKEAHELITRAMAAHVFPYDLILEWILDIHERPDARHA